MKAMMIESHGGPDVFVERQLPIPEPGLGQLRVRVKGTSVNPIDVKLRKAPLPFSLPLPSVLHGDVAGIVDAVGSDVLRFKVGDTVYGVAGGVRGTAGGALAEYMLVDASLMAHAPQSLSLTEAAVLPLVTISAWEALVDRLQVKPGQSVLIHGGLGGVGHVAVQLARWLGAHVHTTVSSDEERALAEELGAHVAINYKTTSVESYVAQYTDGRGFDAVFDTVGGGNLLLSIQAVRNKGAVASIATGGVHDLHQMYLKGVSLHSVLMLLPMLTHEGRSHHGDILARVAQIVDQKALRPLLDVRRFVLADVSKAHALLESGQAKGKIAIEVP